MKKKMILVTFKTPTMPEPRFEGDSLFKEDTIQTLVYNNGNEYEIYQVWYETEHKYTGFFHLKILLIKKKIISY